MFDTYIDKTPFNSPGANEMFGTKIFGSAIMHDDSFVSTLRALLLPRIGENNLRLEYNRMNYGVLSDGALNDSVENAIQSDTDALFVFNCGSNITEEGMVKAFEKLPGWVRVNKVTDFFRKAMQVYCFINPEKRVSAVFTGHLDLRLIHYLQVGIVVFLPWYFDAEHPLTDDEKSLVMSLREEKPDHYNQMMQKLSEAYDFRTAMIRASLAGFESKMDIVQRDSVESEIISRNREIDSLQEEIRSLLNKLDELNTTYLGLCVKIERNKDAGGEMMDYFLANRSLVLESVDNNSITFSVIGYLTYWDDEYVKALIDNDESFLYTASRHGVKRDDAAAFFRAVFIDRTLKIRSCASYTLDMVRGVTGNSHHDYPPECTGYLPNAHIEYHACLGNYRATLNDLIREHEYIGAIEQCIPSSRSMSFHDTSAQEFVRDLYREELPACVELPDGRVVTVRKAIAWLKEEK